MAHFLKNQKNNNSGFVSKKLSKEVEMIRAGA